MSMIKQKPKKYNDGRTKQSFKDSTDINKILFRAQKTGTLSHLAKHEAFYGDFAEFDFTTAQNTIARANSIFEELPSELRNEFGGSPRKFFEYANDEQNVGRLAELLPGLAAPGRQFIDLNKPEEPAAPVAPEAGGSAAVEGVEPVTPAVVETPPPIG